jgi:hypothetical protein
MVYLSTHRFLISDFNCKSLKKPKSVVSIKENQKSITSSRERSFREIAGETALAQWPKEQG